MISQENGISDIEVFDDEAYNMPWILSTSQNPLFQQYREKDNLRSSLGGGFGPPKGTHFGVCYFLLQEKTYFHISCGAKKNPTDECAEFTSAIVESLRYMQELCCSTVERL